LLDRRLIGAAGGEVVEADEPHIARFVGARRGERARQRERERSALQSTCAPEARMIGAHLASSALMNSASFSGVLSGVGSTPTSCRRLRISGSASALRMASLSTVTTGAGVFAGARIAFQV